VVKVLGRPGRGTSQVEKSPRLNWATHFLAVAYDGTCSPNFSVKVANFLRQLSLQGKKYLDGSSGLDVAEIASMKRKDSQFGT